MPSSPEITFILLFVVASTVAFAARRWRIPYTVALVVAGLGLGALQLIEAPHLTRTLLMSLFLPGLLFETAFHLELKAFRREQGTIVALALPGVVVAAALIALVLTPVVGALGLSQRFTWQHALAFGALIAATDPVAVSALLRNLGAPQRLRVLLEGESLLNDGTAIVLFGLVLGLAGGEAIVPRVVLLDFLRIVGMGAVIGAAVGVAVVQVIRRVDEPMIEITLTTVAAYGSFVAAEAFHDSGVIATVVAGMLCGNYGARTGMSASTRVAVETFWDYVAFALNSIVFLLIGFEVRFSALIGAWKIILVAFFVVLLARAAVVFGTASLRRRSERIPHSWRLVLAWGGLRGGVAMVLALSIPASFGHRDLLVATTFGVVILTILVQGLTIAPLLRWLGIVRIGLSRIAFELARGRAQAADAALNELGEMERVGFTHPEVLAGLREEYEERSRRDRREMWKEPADAQQLRREETRRARRRLIQAEKQNVIESFHGGLLSGDAHGRLIADIDARLTQLESGGDELEVAAGAAAGAPAGPPPQDRGERPASR